MGGEEDEDEDQEATVRPFFLSRMKPGYHRRVLAREEKGWGEGEKFFFVLCRLDVV